MRRVVVTGIGIWSCLGNNADMVLEALRKGQSGLIYDESLIEVGMHCPVHGRVIKPDLKPILKDRRARACMPEVAHYAYMASYQAFQNAGVTDEYLLANEVGILFGNDSVGKEVIDAYVTLNHYHDSAAVSSDTLSRTECSTITMNLAPLFHLRGINMTIGAACASSSHAIGISAMLIKDGLQDMILVGGAQEMNQFFFPAFEAVNAATTDPNPQTASKPFSKDRTGLALSGGAAALVLEEYEHAVARGANILAEIVGYGFSSNGVGVTEPSREGEKIAMQRALKQANLQPKDIDYINAHATSTIQGDIEEAVAITELFGENQPWVSSTKSMTGHECWMAGASELVYSILMMQNSFIAPNINLSEPDDAAKKLKLVSKPLDIQVNTIMSNSFGFGGTNSTLIIKKV